MKLTLSLSMVFAAAALSWAGTVPNQITYQGTIKEQGVPVTGTRTMLFQITNSDGSTVYWSSKSTDVVVTQGLFSQVLTPDGVKWQEVTPYIELSVGPKGQTPQVLKPREPITATAYSLMSGAIVDGAITYAKLDPGVQLMVVPPGLVAIFTTSCPAGWTRYEGLDGLFPMGGPTFGPTGGSVTHSHSISVDGSHNHGGMTGFETAPGDSRGDNGAPVARNHHQHPISTDGAHNHGGATGAASSLPPYLQVVYCQKT